MRTSVLVHSPSFASRSRTTTVPPRASFGLQTVHFESSTWCASHRSTSSTGAFAQGGVQSVNGSLRGSRQPLSAKAKSPAIATRTRVDQIVFHIGRPPSSFPLGAVVAEVAVVVVARLEAADPAVVVGDPLAALLRLVLRELDVLRLRELPAQE